MAARQVNRWVHGARSETGYVRRANEDRMGGVRTRFGHVYVVCDGMGGYAGGAIAAELTVDTLRKRLSTLNPGNAMFASDVRDAFQAANAAVYQRRRAEDPETKDMGTTGVALVASGARILVGHVGDSRAYLRRSRGDLKQLTRDHTRVQKLVDGGVLTPAQAAVHPDASTLDRAIGHQPTIEADVSGWITVNPGDMVLLCSDGLCGYASDEEIDKVLSSDGEPQALADKLVKLALSKGGEDNVTVQLVRYGGGRSLLAAARSLLRPAVLVPFAGVVAVASAGVALQARRTSDDLRSQLLAAQNALASRAQVAQVPAAPVQGGVPASGPVASGPAKPPTQSTAPIVAERVAVPDPTQAPRPAVPLPKSGWNEPKPVAAKTPATAADVKAAKAKKKTAASPQGTASRASDSHASGPSASGGKPPPTVQSPLDSPTPDSPPNPKSPNKSEPSVIAPAPRG